MGKRKGDKAARMCKRPRPSSDSSPVGYGGPARRAPAQGPVPAAAGTGLPPTRRSGRRGPTTTPSSSTSSGTPPPQTAPPPPLTGQAARMAAGLSPSPPQQGAFSPQSTPSTPGSSSSGGGSYAGTVTQQAHLPVPKFITRRPNAPPPQLQPEKRYCDAEQLLTYMETNCKDQADELWANSKWHLKIDFNHLKSYDREFSYKICNNYEGNDANCFEGGKDYCIAAARSFLLEHFQTKPLDGKFDSVEGLKQYVEEHVNLSFTRMPSSIERFTDMKHKSKTVRMFAGQKYGFEAIEASDTARRILCKIVDHILGNHKRGWCWDGNWTVNDIEVINGQFINLLADPIARKGRDQSDKDLVQLAKSVLPTFELQGKLPSFMKHLQDELQNLPSTPSNAKFTKQGMSDKDFFGWFYDYIKYHPAMLNPLARSTLLEGFYFCMDKLDYRKLPFYKDLAECAWHVDWRVAFYPPKSVHTILYEVFWYKKTPCSDNMPHDNNYAGLLGYHRHLVQHSADNARTQWFNGEYVQTMKNSDEAELMAVFHEGTFLPKFIRKIFSCDMFKNAELSKRFKVYKDAWGK